MRPPTHVGTLLLDAAVQSGMVTNPDRIFVLRSTTPGTLNTAYMNCAFLGGSTGSWAGAMVYRQFGWPAVCALVALLGVALIRHRSRGGSRPRTVDVT